MPPHSRTGRRPAGFHRDVIDLFVPFGASMLLRKCPRCKELVNVDSVSCPRCGVVFREYRIKRLIFWIVLLTFAAWAVHNHLPRHFLH
jgi:phage FluMu protein Com